ncbi:MAG TPA: SDR family oxidoreductase [Terriglobales bacterium]|nr:SDR family oxidoreductase [Terriglobales bacterium]
MVPLSLEGKVALITGGSRGIGAATVRMFVQAGARVMFNYQRARAAAEALVKECGAERCSALQSDLASEGPAKALVEATVARFGRLDILVANHGIWPHEDIPIEQMTEEHWKRTFAVNLESVFGLVKHAVAQMKRQGKGGHIVLVSSTSGQRGEAFHVDYSATKGALISLTKGLSTELAPHGILVNSVAPGWVATEMVAPTLADPKSREWVLAAQPLRRLATPEEVAGPILFLCTEHAGYITGEILNINGGSVLVG